MNDILHILINDESVGNETSEPSVFSFFDVLKKPFVQLKNSKQLDYLINVLPDSTEIAVWVHPNASQKKSFNVDTPGEASMTALALEEIDFNVISRYPDDVSKDLLKDLEKSAIKLGSLYKEIKNAKTIKIGALKAKDNLNQVNNNIVYHNVDYAIIAALYDDEYTSIKDFIEDEVIVPGFETMAIAKLKNSDKRVLIDFQTKMGMVEATYLATQIASKFSPKYLIMVGVCGGRSKKDVKLLDLIIPSKVFDYQTGKYSNGVFQPYLRSCNLNNKKAINNSEKILRSMEDFVNTPLKKKCREIQIHTKSLACGNVVVKTDGFLEGSISKYDEETQGVEMESFGVVRTTELLEDKRITPIIIKGVMDYTEKGKNDSDKPTAAYLSACYAYFLIKDHL